MDKYIHTFDLQRNRMWCWLFEYRYWKNKFEKSKWYFVVFLFSLQCVSTILQYWPLNLLKNTGFNNWLPELSFVEIKAYFTLRNLDLFLCQKVTYVLEVEKTKWKLNSTKKKQPTKLFYKPWTPSSNLNRPTLSKPLFVWVHWLGALEGCSSTWAVAEWLFFFFSLTCEDIWFTAETSDNICNRARLINGTLIDLEALIALSCAQTGGADIVLSRKRN